MKKILITLVLLLTIIVVISGCSEAPGEKEDLGGFCGLSTSGFCTADADCVTDGCSGQVCRSTSEEPVITTCEYRNCYNEDEYGLSCGCVNNGCKWN